MIITQTPLRVSFLGGNTDFPRYFKKYGGAVLTTTIDKYIYCIVKDRFDKEIRINYSIKEIVNKVKDIKHELVREAMKLVGVKDSIEITFLSDIPSEGSGLGSSSAVTVGALNALHCFKGESIGARQLAEEACKIEVDLLKRPIGLQDQYAVAFGNFNLIEFGKSIKLKQIDSHNLEDYLVLLHTGKTRDASKILSGVKLKKKILDRNKALAKKGYMNLRDPKRLGELLDEYWELKKELNPAASSTEIDEMYKKAKKAGAWGGKIVGAGGGGFLLLVTPTNKKTAIKKKLGLRELPIRFSRSGSKVIFDIQK